MPNPVEIENIEALRRRNGIDDVELRAAIRSLSVGDLIKLTLLSSTAMAAGETVSVRITRIRGAAFRGTLTTRPTTAGLAQLRVGSPLVFRSEHIHSIAKQWPTHEH